MNTNSFNCSDTTRHRLLQTVLTGKELVISTIHLIHKWRTRGLDLSRVRQNEAKEASLDLTKL